MLTKNIYGFLGCLFPGSNSVDTLRTVSSPTNSPHYLSLYSWMEIYSDSFFGFNSG